MTWSKDDLERFAESDELHIAPLREDGVSFRSPTRIWGVVVGESLYVRAYHGTGSRWHQAALRQHAGRISAAGKTIEVTFEPVEEGALQDRIDDAYRAKYRKSPYLEPMKSARARSATVRVTPREK